MHQPKSPLHSLTSSSGAAPGGLGTSSVAAVETYLELEHIVDLVKLFLISVAHAHALAQSSWPTRCNPMARPTLGYPLPIPHLPSAPPLPGKVPYLAVNSSNVSSECWSRAGALCENALNAMGAARYTGSRVPSRLALDAARTKDMVRLNGRGGAAAAGAGSRGRGEAGVVRVVGGGGARRAGVVRLKLLVFLERQWHDGGRGWRRRRRNT